METLRRTACVAACLLITGTVVSAQTSVSIGVQIGPPPPPRVVYVAPPPPPQPEFVWVEGYWYPVDRHYMWHDGYWTRPPYEGAYWVAPYNSGGRYFVGRWEGERGNVNHNHRWDRGNQRDERRDSVPDGRNGRNDGRNDGRR